MLQLANAGIGAWEILAKAIGKSVAETRKMAEAGQIEGQWAASAILEGIGERFAGQMSQMENSWKGAWSTIRDIARMTIGAVTKDLFQGANRWLVKVKDRMPERFCPRVSVHRSAVLSSLSNCEKSMPKRARSRRLSFVLTTLSGMAGVIRGS
ncbi:MAG TPA: tape measure protein [Firmicutes bacterium]|jgi:hypothetical protein|nr:tape measure protein [Candidatus Fermentithermobacillaceae bacterium]